MHDHRVLDPLEDRPGPTLGGDQLPLDPHLFGDVLQRAADAHHAPPIVVMEAFLDDHVQPPPSFVKNVLSVDIFPGDGGGHPPELLGDRPQVPLAEFLRDEVGDGTPSSSSRPSPSISQPVRLIRMMVPSSSIS